MEPKKKNKKRMGRPPKLPKPEPKPKRPAHRPRVLGAFVAINVKLPVALYVDTLARSRIEGKTISGLVREALEALVHPLSPGGRMPS